MTHLRLTSGVKSLPHFPSYNCDISRGMPQCGVRTHFEGNSCELVALGTVASRQAATVSVREGPGFFF